MELKITLSQENYLAVVDGIADVIGELEDRKTTVVRYRTDDWMIDKLGEVFMTIFAGMGVKKKERLSPEISSST